MLYIIIVLALFCQFSALSVGISYEELRKGAYKYKYYLSYSDLKPASGKNHRLLWWGANCQTGYLSSRTTFQKKKSPRFLTTEFKVEESGEIFWILYANRMKYIIC